MNEEKVKLAYHLEEAFGIRTALRPAFYLSSRASAALARGVVRRSRSKVDSVYSSATQANLHHT